MDTTLLPDDDCKVVGKMSLQEADRRADAYVDSVLADVDPELFAETEMSSEEFISTVRQKYYAFIASHYQLVVAD